MILYKILISCAKIAGNAMLTAKLPMEAEAILSSLDCGAVV
jgi:hypothetical protein